VAAIEVRLGKLRFHLQGLPEGSDRLVELAKKPQDVAAVEQRQRVPWCKLDGRVIRGERLHVAAEFLEGHAAIAVGISEARREAHGFFETRQRLRRLPVLQVEHAENVSGAGMDKGTVNSASKHSDRVADPAGLRQIDRSLQRLSEPALAGR
jgi:hypothetical protein